MNNDKSDKSYNTQLKILQAATEVFSEKGFDGARVDEIAARAKVNKALLYYYFESKEKLLEELILRYTEEAKEVQQKAIENVDWSVQAEADKFIEEIFDFMESKREIIRIITLESLKASSQDNTIFQSLLPSFETRLSSQNQNNRKSTDSIGIMIDAFFFGMIPSAVFLTLGDRWSDYYGFNRDAAKKKFMEIFKGFRYAYYHPPSKDTTKE